MPPHIILDPANIENPEDHPDPPVQIPRVVRDFGYLPNTQLWRPGDLILVSSIKPGFISRSIIKVQRGIYSDEDALWHHAAVYIGDDIICEATGKGVNPKPIFPYIGNHKIRVRRDLALTIEDSYKIAIQALFRIKYKYSFGSIIRLLLQANKANIKPKDFSKASTICSQLYADAYGAVTGRTIDNRTDHPITPAGLSGYSGLIDVDVSWQKLP